MTKSSLGGDSGFTLVEVLVAVGLFAMTALAFLTSLTMCTYMASYSRHRIQAIYVAQRILEEERRQTFAGLASQNYGAVSLDTKGTFASSADDYMGTATITVTTLNAYMKKVQVEVDWQERTALGTVTKKEYCTTNIANEPQMN